MRVFLGCEEIAANLEALSEAFTDLGHQVTSFVFNINKFYQQSTYDVLYTPFIKQRLNYEQKNLPKLLRSGLYRTDKILTTIDLRRQSSKIIKNHDLFVFIWCPWLPEKYLFPHIVAAGKPIVILHMGSDVRHVASFSQEYGEDVSLWESFFHTEDLNEKIEKIRMHEKYATLIYSVPDQSGLYIRPYNHLHMILSRKKKFQFQLPDHDIPTVVHAPSKSGIKGTKFILEAIDQLKQEGLIFNFKMLEGVPNHEVLAALTDADILLDELLLHGPGALSAEAMASGCAVATRTLTQYKNIFDPPVINVNPQNVVSQLRRLITDKSLRLNLAIEGKQFFERHNTAVRFADRIISDLAGNGVPQYIPYFYLESFVLPQHIRLTTANKRISAEIAYKYYKGPAAAFDRAMQNGLIA